jgi:hypothetical protein
MPFLIALNLVLILLIAAVFVGCGIADHYDRQRWAKARAESRARWLRRACHEQATYLSL